MTACRWGPLLLLLVGCTPAPPPPAASPDPAPVDAEGLHNLFRVSDRLYSGSSPEGESGFASLRRLGVKTVISVDGARPAVELAERHGLRYVHLPIGYDGIPSDRAALLAKAVRDLPGPVYVHCHHGKHRGPAACAAIQLALDPSWTQERAGRWLAAAGTDRRYVGLVGLPATFKRPTTAELDAVPADFQAAATVPDLVRRMVEIDSRWDRLKAIKAAGWKAPPDHPDLDPAHEAVVLSESYREATRAGDAAVRGQEFVALMIDGESAARDLEQALRTGDVPAATKAFNRSQTACSKCHEKYRDRK